MNKIKFYFFVLCSSALTLFSCDKTDTPSPTQIRDYGYQYSIDIAKIEDYLKTHTVEMIVDHPGFNDDQNIIIKEKMDGNVSIYDDPRLFSKEVEFNNVTYKLYYFKAREGDMINGESPSRVDEILVSYKGSYIVRDEEPEAFDSVDFPESYFGLSQLIRGWAEVIPLFKTGTKEIVEGPNPTVYNDFGAGIMFIPSGLGYFNNVTSNIPAYSSLIFSFKLYEINRADQDQDGVLSIDEDLNKDGIFTNDDTDGDLKQNYQDTDDDGDGYLTKNEIKIDGVFPLSYDLILDCNGTNTGVKKHLDRGCH